MTRYQRAKRRASWASATLAVLFYLLLIFLPAIGGYITDEQPATAPITSR